jgi:translation initiation factor IF-3
MGFRVTGRRASERAPSGRSCGPGLPGFSFPARVVARRDDRPRGRHEPQEIVKIAEKRVRVNEQIRISPIRLIAENGGQIGIVSLDEARARAAATGLDLVEVAPDSRPPVVRMMDYGKYKYKAARAAREARRKQHTTQIKEVKFRPGIEDHDYEFKLRHARRFLAEGNKVKLTMMFRGRQITHPELGRQVLLRLTEDLDEVGKVEQYPNFEGRQMSMILTPLKV